MFVSSFNTYANITPSTTNKTEKTNGKDALQKDDLFSKALSSKDSLSSSLLTSNSPNYISKGQVEYNKQKFQTERELQKNENQQLQQTNKVTQNYSINASIQNAKIAYLDNSTTFSFLLKPKTTLNQTPTINKKLPSDFQEAQEKVLRNAMVNTYQANENYYQITSVA